MARQRKKTDTIEQTVSEIKEEKEQIKEQRKAPKYKTNSIGERLYEDEHDGC